MSFTGSPTNINLNDTDPSPKPDRVNVEWQAGAAVFDPSTGTWTRPASACYAYPQVGGVFVIDDNAVSPYLLSATDSGQTILVNRTTAITIQCPANVPFFDNPAQGVWNVRIESKGAGIVTIDPNGLNLDGSASSQTIAKGSGLSISTDNTDYWSFGRSNGSVIVDSSANSTLTGAINGSNTSFTTRHSAILFLGILYNGIFKVDGFSVSGTTLTTTFTPDSGDRLDALYLA